MRLPQSRVDAFRGPHFFCCTVQVQWESDDDEREGPAARAVRTLEQQVAAAAEEATTGSIEEGSNSISNSKERRLGH